jgi:hypothetical protein
MFNSGPGLGRINRIPFSEFEPPVKNVNPRLSGPYPIVKEYEEAGGGKHRRKTRKTRKTKKTRITKKSRKSRRKRSKKL